MLKWTASAQKLPQDTTSTSSSSTASTMSRTPQLSAARRRRHQRRATIANNNKENIIPFTSTPMVMRQRNSPLVLAPLTDILNVTPEPAVARTPEQRVLSTRVGGAGQSTSNRRHSTLGLTMPSRVGGVAASVVASSVAASIAASAVMPYASTLPRFQEEEYSPSTALPTGQQLAMRGLLPDPFLGHPRYFATPEARPERRQNRNESKPTSLESKTTMFESKTTMFESKTTMFESKTTMFESKPTTFEPKSMKPKKRKLEQEFAEIAREVETKPTMTTTTTHESTMLSSAKMGDQTLDHLIDAILDSARKEEKKNKKPRKSFNLRRRTLLKNQAHEAAANDLMLSPSYAAGDDPASDLSFLLMEPQSAQFRAVTPQPASPIVAVATPPPGTPCSIPDNVLKQMPTPKSTIVASSAACRLRQKHQPKSIKQRNDSFMLATPVRPLAQKRLRQPTSTMASTEVQAPGGGVGTPPKRFKVDARNYFEIGLALPSIYV